MGKQFLGRFSAGMGGQQDPLAKLLLGQDPQLNPTGYNTPPITASTAAANPISQDLEGVDDIVVEGANRNGGFNVTEAEIPDLPLKNAKVLEELLEAREGNPQRKGMFGIKGTLRDILGTVGDAFLVQSGNKQVYAPQRAQERRADAMAGFTQDQMAAVERMAQEDPDTAIKLYEYVQSNAAKEQAAAAARQKAQVESVEKGGRIIGQISGSIKSQEAYDRNKSRLQYVIDTYGLGDFVKLPEKYDAEFISELEKAGMQVNQQITTSQGERRLDQGEVRNKISQQRADADTTRANRPPAGRAAPNPTNASQAAPLIAKERRGETLTPNEERVLRRLGYSEDRGKKSTSTRPPLQRKSGATQGSSTPRAPTIKW